MNKKILIIGEKGFIASNLYKYLKKKNNKVYSSSFEKFIKKKVFKKSDIIINCTSNKRFIKNHYNISNDHDLMIANKIINSKTKLVMLSTRKIYKKKFNINRDSRYQNLWKDLIEGSTLLPSYNESIKILKEIQ